MKETTIGLPVCSLDLASKSANFYSKLYKRYFTAIVTAEGLWDITDKYSNEVRNDNTETI